MTEEMEVPFPAPESAGPSRVDAEKEIDEIRLRKQALEAVLQQCQRTLELLRTVDDPADPDPNDGDDDDDPSQSGDTETDELCHLVKSRVESPAFLEKLGSIHVPVAKNVSDECFSWDVVDETDLWGELTDGDNGSDGDGYIVVRREDIVEGVACFMAAYLLSLKETRELTPNQLQEALSKMFSVKKKKGKLGRAWDGTKVIYNVASWGATAIGIYQNPALLKAASVAFWTSCRAISKLL